MLAKFAHCQNAPIPIFVTLLGIVMLTKFLQSEKTSPKFITPAGILYDVLSFPIGYFISSVLFLLNRTPS